jgi:hypothetical protein
VTEAQIRLDGTEVELNDEFAVARSAMPLSPVQRLILASAPIRSVEAGVIVHASRGHCGFGARGGRIGHVVDGKFVPLDRPKGIACCAYAAADGLEACKRLAKRGLLRRVAPGRWEST